MRILIQSALVVDPASPHHKKNVDVLVEDSIIKTIAAGGSIKEKADRTLKHKNQHLSIGWFDMRANFREPGFEYKEELSSGCAAAIRGGFTGVMLMPSTDPPVSGKPDVEFIRNKTAGALVHVVPAGTVSHKLEGTDLSEMYDMWLSGARAFTDDKLPIADAGLMLRALMYAKNFGGLILSYADDKDLSAKGQINEGVMNVNLGMKGMPVLAEEVRIARDIALAEYADAPLHFSTVSSAAAVDRIREAKKKGMKITADVAVHNIVLDESSLAGFDTHYKVLPPLRTHEDIAALMEGLADGTLDCIVSDHSPEDVENKRREFELASFGIIGLESAFGLLNQALARLSLEQRIQLITTNPRKILGIDMPSIQEGMPADLTLFDPGMEWTFSESDIGSKSRNTPFLGKSLVGRALAVVNKGQVADCIQQA